MQNPKRVAILIGPNFHDEEATIPRDFLVEKGAQADWIGLDLSQLTGKYGRITLAPHKSIDQIAIKDYDGLIIPGGGAPERLRVVPRVLDIVRDFWETGRPVGAICHGPQVLISAGLLSGVTTTCYVGIRDDVKMAGAVYVDREVCIDGQLITSRNPDDLPAFNKAFWLALTKPGSKVKKSNSDALDVLEIAISREKGAQEFYTGMAKILQGNAIQNKFNYLATVEKSHFEQLSELFRKVAGERRLSIQQQNSEIGSHKISLKISSEQAIELAVEAEQKAYDFYRKAALKAKGQRVKEMFEYLASEEAEHKRLLSVDMAVLKGGVGHFQWATHWDIPPGMEDLW
jgi:protease I